MKINLKLFIGSMALLVIGPCGMSATPASAQDATQTAPQSAGADPLVHLSPRQASQFQTALDALAKQAHVALVAEGAPLTPRLAGKAVPDLTADAPVGQAVTRLASAYDYDAQRVNGVFVLTKRYTDPLDLPCVTLSECCEAAQDVCSVLDAFSPNLVTSWNADGPDGQRDVVVKFFATLSAGQLQAAQAGTLRYGSLLPDQQTLVQQLFFYQYAQMPSEDAHWVVDKLEYAPRTVLTAQNDSGTTGVFIEVPSPYDATKRLQLPISGKLTLPGQPQPDTPPLPTPGADPAAPVGTTLQSLVAGLKPVHDQQPLVDAALQDKPVTVAGVTNAASMDVLRALVALYGLRIGAAESGAPKLERPMFAPPTDARQIGPAAWGVLPVSCLRALHGVGDGHRVEIPAPPSSPPASAGPPDVAALRAAAEAWVQQMSHLDTPSPIPAALQQSACRRVQEAMQPHLRQDGPRARIPIASLDAHGKAALAALLMAGLMLELQNDFTGLPKQNVLDCMDDMDQTVISTHPGEAAQIKGVTIPSLYLEGTDPYTHEKVGLGGVRFFTPK